MSEPIDLKRFAPQRVLLLADQLDGEGLFESRGVQEGWAALNQFKFRDQRGEWWTAGICSRQWYRFVDRHWRFGASPDGFLEGPAELEKFAFPADAPTPGADDFTASSAPAPNAIEAITRIVRDTFGDYESGRLNSMSTTLLLRGHFLVDRTGRVWSLGCRSRKWYFLEAGQWHAAAAPPTPDSLPDPSQFAAMRSSGQLAVLTFLALEASSLPEPVTDPWNPPPSFPETPPPPAIFCTSCGAMNLRGSRFCSRCGAEPAKLAPPPRSAAAPAHAQCPRCSSPLAPGATFCLRCGASLAQSGSYG
jgi:hypothetical protein